MFIKVLAVLGFVAVASASDLTVGVDGGKIIYEQNVTASPAIWRQTQNITVYVTNSDEVISRVVVIDNRPEKDGEAKVVEGGEGHKNITIELQSPAVFRGFNFSVQVFAAPENLKSNGIDTQYPQVPYVKDVMHGTEKVDDKDIILGTPKLSTPEAPKPNNDNQDKFNIPAITGNEQSRLNRDTESQKTSEQTPIATATDLPSGSVVPAKDIQTKKSVHDEHDLQDTIDAVFASNGSIKSVGDEESQAVIPHSNDDQQKTVEKDVVPALNGDEKLNTFKSTEAKNMNEVKFVPITGESSSTSDDKSTTESAALPDNVKTTLQLEHNVKGQDLQHHKLPLPYVNH